MISEDRLRAIGRSMIMAAGCLWASAESARNPEQREAIEQLARLLIWNATVIHLELEEPCFEMLEGM
jgi:hypothetical protein